MTAAFAAYDEDSVIVDVAVAAAPSERRSQLEQKFPDVRSYVRMARTTMMLDAAGIESALEGIYPGTKVVVALGTRPGAELVGVVFRL